jgi:hypothetical protein
MFIDHFRYRSQAFYVQSPRACSEAQHDVLAGQQRGDFRRAQRGRRQRQRRIGEATPAQGIGVDLELGDIVERQGA